MLISDVAVVSWLAVQTVALIAQGAITRNDIKWIKDSLKDAGIEQKERTFKSNNKAEKQTAHDTASDVQDARLMEKLEGLTRALTEHVKECKDTRSELMEEVHNNRKNASDKR